MTKIYQSNTFLFVRRDAISSLSSSRRLAERPTSRNAQRTSGEVVFSSQLNTAMVKRKKPRNKQRQGLFELVEIEPVSSLRKHIEAIEHVPWRRQVKVQLKAGSRCRRPYLMGRLSGQSIGMIDWETGQGGTEFHTNGTTLKGEYNVPTTGRYYIEIIIIYCTPPLDYYDKASIHDKCVENQQFSRITALNASINVAYPNILHYGYWETPRVSTPLYTRWQPSGCRPPNDISDRCIEKTSLRRFMQYRFRWSEAHASRGVFPRGIPKVKMLQDWSDHADSCAMSDARKCHVCTVGASHSRRLYRFLEGVEGMPEVGYFEVKYPDDVDKELIVRMTEKCGTIVLGLSQWSAYTPEKRYSPYQFAQQYDDMLSLFEKYNAAKARIVVRSVHRISMGDIMLHCPVWELRTPTIMERYNVLLREICANRRKKGHDVEFLDTDFITLPMWDSSRDWNHVMEKVQKVEAQYVAAALELDYS
eukprot:CAMPEP_0172504546 /NCGR_PEP_ID=MMETSP1066-20121228/179664_1 /TAXON_ID=671091 /ORGANISM="Coscinodiscus wailesii, Strain CCMP2513" /LENGTH=474 /DNA_ID=CAMNT_0013280777 /DNA_START=169 /DNA_END=1596 /DNA_ORIENTATION=-